MNVRRKTSWRQRGPVVSRVLAALLGGYATTAAGTAALALYLPLSRIDATIAATLASFAVYALAIMWAFAARTAWRAWAGLLLPGAVLAACVLPALGGGA